MFREMRRRKQALDKEVCDLLLIEEKRGVLAVNGDEGYPYAIPVDFYYDPNASAIYIHSALSGHKVDAIVRDSKACFTVWNKGSHESGDWSYFVDSVVAFGRASFVEDENERLHIAKLLGLKYYPSAEEVDAEIENAFDRMLLIRIDIEHMTGKHVHEK